MSRRSSRQLQAREVEGRSRRSRRSMARSASRRCLACLSQRGSLETTEAFAVPCRRRSCGPAVRDGTSAAATFTTGRHCLPAGESAGCAADCRRCPGAPGMVPSPEHLRRCATSWTPNQELAGESGQPSSVVHEAPSHHRPSVGSTVERGLVIFVRRVRPRPHFRLRLKPLPLPTPHGVYSASVPGRSIGRSAAAAPPRRADRSSQRSSYACTASPWPRRTRPRANPACR